MLVSATATASLLLSVCLSLTLADTKEPLQHQYHPYHQHRVSNYHNRRNVQRGLNLHQLHHNYRAQRVKAPASPVRREDKKLFPVFPAQQNRNRIPHQENLHLHRRPSASHRAQRKIEIEPSKLDQQFLKTKSNGKKNVERNSKEEEEDDNIAVESNILETRVRPEAPVAPVAPVATRYSGPGPKFIIKQAGPSQQFGWLGHGRFAPLNIPNIFQTVGLNTAWLPGVNSVFPVGLNYPGPASHHTHSPGPVTVKKTTTLAPVRTEKYKAPTTTATTTASSLGEIPVYQPSHNTPLPAYRPGNKQNQMETLYYGSQIVNLYTPPVKTTTTTTTATTATTTTTTPTTTTYKPVTTTPTLKFTYKTYKTTSRPAAPFRYSSAPVTSPSPSYISTPAPYYGHSSPQYGYGSPQPSIAPYHNTPQYGYGSPQPTIAPYHSSPQYGYGSPQPSQALHGNYHQPSSVRPFTAFTAFSRSTPAPAPAPAPVAASQAPIVGIIETEELKNSDKPGDGEVFYIFYENEDLPQKTGNSGLKRFIHEEIAKEVAEDNLPSESIVHESKDVSNKFPNFALIEEINKPEPAVFYDVPIKIEETGEGFDPPSEIRTIYVPIENAINVPENFQIDIGTSFGGGGSQAAGKKIVRKVRKQAEPGLSSQPYYGSRLEPRRPADPLV